MTRLTVYNHFDSKGGLMEAVFDDLAQRGGLFELPAVFSKSDPDQGLRLLVSTFCRFWTMHGTILPNFRGAILADAELTASLKQRAERRREILTALVGRMMRDPGRRGADLVDVLFALTSFEVFEALRVRNRSAEAVEALIQAMAESAVERYRAGR